jgi:hypothetical protein
MTPVDDIPHLELAERVRNVEARLCTDQVETAREHGLPRDLVAVEESIWKRLSPFKNRWPEITEFDMRVAELEQRQAEIQSELADLHARANAAPDLDAAALADWELSNRKGPRPAPTLPDIQDEIKQRQSSWEASRWPSARCSPRRSPTSRLAAQS